MRYVAILVDLGFFLPRYKTLVERGASPPHTPKEVASAVWRTALRHVDSRGGEQLYRVLVYDCKPLTKKAHNPVSNRAVDFAREARNVFRNEVHRELVCLRKVALRLGELHDGNQWLIKSSATKRLIRREISVDDLQESDVFYDSSQKGVDIKFGIDIASLAYKRLVSKVVLITGDADFVPAAKLARREGLDVVLDPLWNHISPSLHEHIDGLKSVWPRPGSRSGATALSDESVAEPATGSDEDSRKPVRSNASRLRGPWPTRRSDTVSTPATPADDKKV